MNMPLRIRAAAALLLCTAITPGCTPLAPNGCAGRLVACPSPETGRTRSPVRILSAPTPAAIYLDGRFIGYSPLTYPVSFTSETGRIHLVAVPLYPGQAQQEEVILVPPLPKRVSFFMNNPPAASGADAAAEPISRDGR